MFRSFTTVRVALQTILAVLVENVLTNIANSIYPDQTDHIGSIGSVSTLIEPILSTEWQCLSNKTGMYEYKAITILKCVMLLTLRQ